MIGATIKYTIRDLIVFGQDMSTGFSLSPDNSSLNSWNNCG